MNNQSRWLIALCIGFITFISSYGSYLVEHDNGSDLGHALIIGGSALGSMFAALKYQIPRNYKNYYNDRVSDTKLNELNRRGNE